MTTAERLVVAIRYPVCATAVSVMIAGAVVASPVPIVEEDATRAPESTGLALPADQRVGGVEWAQVLPGGFTIPINPLQDPVDGNGSESGEDQD